MKVFYHNRAYAPVWSDDFKPLPVAEDFLTLIAQSSFYGLDTSFYEYGALTALKHQLETEKELHLQFRHAARFELQMTHTAFQFISNLRSGVLYPDSAIYGHRLQQYPDSLHLILAGALESENFKQAILNVQPRFREYVLAQKGLEQYIKSTILNKDSFSLPDPKTDSLKCYTNAKNILQSIDYIPVASPYNIEPYAEMAVKRLLSIPGLSEPELPPIFNAVHEKNYDDSVFVVALKQFQRDHGLGADGVIGQYTRSALLMGNYNRFQQAAANLERMRWERNVPQKYALVNIPAYNIRVIENGKVINQQKVMVGTTQNQTPTLNSQIEYFVTHPEWNVPYSISTKEILPKIKKDPTYLKRNNYIVKGLDHSTVNTDSVDWNKVNKSNFNFRITQGGGRGNSLGTIKFIFPNKYSVYLHDTPSKRLFDNSIRAYSHGCMRLQNPQEFGEFLLKFDKSDRVDTFKTKMEKHEKMYFSLREPLPIRIRYYTIETDETGRLIFYKDIYRKDKVIINQLFGKS